jgi:hypothetical protein
MIRFEITFNEVDKRYAMILVPGELTKEDVKKLKGYIKYLESLTKTR